MKELSLNVLDITENSTKAGSLFTKIELVEEADKLTVTVTDTGCGMDEETLRSVTDPFYTTRTTRSVGLGVPLFKEAAEQTGGSFYIRSQQSGENKGTEISATFIKSHIDCAPLGDIVATMITLISGHPDKDFLFSHKTEGKEILLDTREVRAVLGDVPLSEYEVLKWLEDFLREQYVV